MREEVLMESKSMRSELLGRKSVCDVLDKAGDIFYLGDDRVVTIKQVADFYEVTKRTIENLISDHRDELIDEDGVKVLKGEGLKGFKGSEINFGSLENSIKYSSALTLFPRRGILRVGMLLERSEVAKTIRSYLLNIEEVATKEQKDWAFERAVSKRIRRSFTDAIKDSGQPKKYGNKIYPDYTNMIYKIVLGMTARKLKEVMGIKKGETPKDYISQKKLKEIISLEDTAKGLLELGLDYEHIEEMLKNAYDKKIS